MLSKATTIIAILVIGALLAYAMSQGINGLALAGGCAIIAGLGGYAVSHRKKD